jgi:ankyrin repeat protein
MCRGTLISAIVLSALSSCLRIRVGEHPPFIKAAQLGDVATVERLFREGADINQTTVGHQTALHIAAAEGQDRMVDWLIAHEADLLLEDDHKKTPADRAHEHEHEHERAERALRSLVEKRRKTQQAVAAHDARAIEELFRSDVQGYTALHVFAATGAVESVKRQIGMGADVNGRTVLGFTPLMRAAVAGQIAIATILIQAGADVNMSDIRGNTAIIDSALMGNVDLTTILLSVGANPNVRERTAGYTPLKLAESKGHTALAEVLRKAGARE